MGKQDSVLSACSTLFPNYPEVNIDRIPSWLVSGQSSDCEFLGFNDSLVPVSVNLPSFIERLGLVRRRRDGKEISSRAVNRAY